MLDEAAIDRFRTRYVELFGAADRNDLLYQSVTEGRRSPGMEHWLPLFSEEMATFFDFIVGAARWSSTTSLEDAVGRTLGPISPITTRRGGKRSDEAGDGPRCLTSPIPPEQLYLPPDEWAARVDAATRIALSPFVADGGSTVDLGGRQGRTFAAERSAEGTNVFDALIEHARLLVKDGKRVAVACWSDGSRDRMGQVLADRGLTELQAARQLARRAGPAEGQRSP